MKLLPKYRVSTQFDDVDYTDKSKAKVAFESIQETASLWRAVQTKRGQNKQSWIGIKFKTVRYGRTRYFNY